MSSSPWTVVDADMYGAGAASKVGYTDINDGTTPLCHMGIFLGDLLRLSPLYANFSSYSTRRATDRTVGTTWGPLFLFSLHVVI